MRPGQTIQPVDLLNDLPLLAQAGSCFAMDRRGIGRYLYVLVPTGAGTATFWRYDTQSNTWQQLATPAVGAASVIGTGTAMILDESTGSVWLFMAESATAGGTEWARWQRYDPATNTWTARTVVLLGLAAQWATDACLTHPDSTMSGVWGAGAPAQNDYIYLTGNGVVTLYRYRISTDAWALLAGAGGARAGAPGAGATLDVSSIYADRIVSLRGGGSNALDQYAISTDTWATGAVLPGTETFGAGTESCHSMQGGVSTLGGAIGGFYVHQAGRIKRVNIDDASVIPVGQIYGTDGVPHLGRGIAAYSVGSAHYLLVRPHGKAELQRIRLID